MQAFNRAPGADGSLEAIELVPSGGGAYEIFIDGRLVYSKLATRAHIADADAIALIRQEVG